MCVCVFVCVRMCVCVCEMERAGGERSHIKMQLGIFTFTIIK